MNRRPELSGAVRGLIANSKRLQFSGKGKNFTVTDGPFTETKEVIAGFALWEIKSIEETLEWAKTCPVTMDCVVEMRPLYSPETWDLA